MSGKMLHLALDIILSDVKMTEKSLIDFHSFNSNCINKDELYRSIFEQDKQLNIIKKRKEYIERRLETPESKLKVKLVTRGKLINKIFKSKKSETQYFRTSLLMKAGREEALVEYKKEIELLQENISITSEQLLMSEKGNIE
uniref:Uncharacterized protein n=1 Tax=Amphimedon queenslandica TaxID=400682 RepID=A0A1X7T8M9_AMPQE